MNLIPYAALPFVPGPTTLHPDVAQVLANDYGSGLLEDDFLPFYAKTVSLLQPIFGTKNDIALMTGEGMVALWGALKSCLQQGDAVLCIGTGVFGDGFAPMAQALGCKVTLLEFAHNTTINTPEALERIEAAIKQCQPKMITLVHCETPSGTCNPLAEVGALKKQYNVPLLCVDAVASAGGEPVNADTAHIDLLLVGSQKCLSAPPSMSMVAVSPAAWDIIKQVNYAGYDALLPFAAVLTKGEFPYTPYWHGVACLQAAAKALHDEGLEEVYARHAQVANRCRLGLQGMGITLFPLSTACYSNTVTAAFIPEQYTWASWQHALREQGLIVADTYGAAQGKVFRIGHMGTQARAGAMEQALEIIASKL